MEAEFEYLCTACASLHAPEVTSHMNEHAVKGWDLVSVQLYAETNWCMMFWRRPRTLAR
jgi:hypothetical protein